MKVFNVNFLAIVISICAIIMLYKVYVLDRPERILEQMAVLRDRAKANPPDKEALDTLIKLTQSKNPFERTDAIAYLGQVGSRAAPGVDALIGALNSNDPFSAREAANSLGEIGPGARPAVPDLIKAVKQYPDADIGWFAAESLGQIGTSNDVEVVAVLRHAAKSSDESMRNSAIEGLEALGISN